MPLRGKLKSGKIKEPKPNSRFYGAEDADKVAAADSGRKSVFYVSPPSANGISGSAVDAARSDSSQMARRTTYDKVEPDEWHRRSSVLNKTLAQVLSEHDVQCYFVQFMHARGAEHVLKFWLSADDFAKAAQTMHTRRRASKDTVCDGKASILPESPNTDIASDYEDRIKQYAVSIYSRYIALDCTHPIGISDSLRNSAISRMCPEDGAVDPFCFLECQFFAENLMKEQHLNDFLRSSYFRKYQVEVLTSDRLHLIDLLYNTKALEYFREFMEQENASDLLQFWVAVDNFEGQLLQGNYSEAKDDAMVLYDRYFSLQATEPLGFTDKIRTLVELNICSEDGPRADCFIVPKVAILKSINSTYFPSFRQSKIFYHHYLSELIQDLHDEPPRRESLSSSDAQSIGSHEGASRDAETAKKPEELDEQPLWTREHAGKMSLGHVNEYGIFISQLDQLPDKKPVKPGYIFLKKQVKEKKEKEEMAWKIAQMIISEVRQDVSSCNAASHPTSSL